MEAEKQTDSELSLEAGTEDSPEGVGLVRLLRLTNRLLGTSYAAIILQDELDPSRYAVTVAGSEVSIPAALASRLSASTTVGSLHSQLWATGEPVILTDLETAPIAADSGLRTVGIRSVLGILLAHPAGEPLGTLWAFDRAPRAWQLRDLESLRAGGEALTAEVRLRKALHRLPNADADNLAGNDARLAVHAQERAAAFQSLGQRLNTATTPREAAEIILAVADQLLGWDACWLDLCDFDTCQAQSVLLMDLVAGERQEVPSTSNRLTEENLCWRAAREGAFCILHTEESLRHSLRELVAFGDLSRASASLLCAPIRSGSRVFGALSVQSYSFNAYTQADLETLQALADYCSGALQRTMAETERHELQSQLLQSQKMEAVGRLAGGVAHDFNNMLAVINGYAELLLMRWSPGSPDRGPVEEILKAGQRAAALTRQLLAFSRKQMTAPQVLDLAEAVMQTQKMLRRLIGEDVELVTLPEPNAGRVLADPSQIDQILVNLAVNARDAMPSGGKLIIRVNGTTLSRLSIGQPDVIPAGQYVVLEVTDTGCGIPPDTLEHVFEPFFTTKPVGQGSGLGLATVLGTVKQNGGFIQVESKLESGTSFRLYLPALANESAAERSQTASATPQGTETLLLVEDEEMLRGLLKSFLESQGYTVLQAAHGEEAMRLCQQYGEVIQLLLTDVVMPVKGGRELADWMRIHHPHVRVLYMSGYTDDAMLRHGLEASGTHFIQKPFTTAALAQKVRAVLDGVAPAEN